ncbi:MAG: hypothetical protein ACRBN8_08800 [Nannocystales bacterium]
MSTVLGDPKRLRTPGGHGYLVSWKHRLKVQDDERSAALVQRILDDPTNLESLRAGIGQPQATRDELAEWLATGLSSGALELLKTRTNPPVMDRPPEANLFDLLPPQEPRRELESLSFEVVDGDGEGVAARYQVHAPSGEPAGVLPAGERRRVGELEGDAYVEVELSGLQLPPREDGDTEDEKPESPLGPGATQPERPGEPRPLGPGGVEPEPVGPGPVGPQPSPSSVVCVRIVGFFFDLEKSFVLPSAMDGIRKIVDEYARCEGFSVLAVGHTDTAGAASYNMDLSLERAMNLLAFLQDDTSAWLAMYDDSVAASRRWGCLEDLHMLRALGFSGRIAEFQTAQAIEDDGIIGPITREKLVQSYMGLDETTLPAGVTSVAHGCGEHFPAIETADGQLLEDNRRVELFFFDGPVDPLPAAATSGPGSTDHPAWAASASETIDIRAGTEQDSLRLALYDGDGALSANTHFAALVDGETITGMTDAEGLAEFPFVGPAPSRLEVAWDGPSPSGPFEYVRQLRLADDAHPKSWISNLSNLGYHSGEQPEEAVLRFQIDEGVDAYPFPEGDQPDLPAQTRTRLVERSEQHLPKK